MGPVGELSPSCLNSDSFADACYYGFVSDLSDGSVTQDDNLVPGRERTWYLLFCVLEL